MGWGLGDMWWFGWVGWDRLWFRMGCGVRWNKGWVRRWYHEDGVVWVWAVGCVMG